MLDMTTTDDTCHGPTPSPFPPHDSAMFFPVVERPNAWINMRTGVAVPIGKQKSLIRKDADDNAQWLANVGDKYKVVHNSDLFSHVEQHMIDVIDPKFMTNVTTKEHMAYAGRDCYREYIFNDMKCTVANSDVAYRVIFGNSYGSKAITMLSGAIDFFCTNGMIIGQSEKQARKHTSGITLHGLDEWINNSVSLFAAHGVRMQRYADTVIKRDDEDALFKYLNDKGLLSNTMVRRMRQEMHSEKRHRRGTTHQSSVGIPTPANMWHLYSALTNWASHDVVRDTGNDHEANTRIQRTQHAERVVRAADNYMEVV